MWYLQQLFSPGSIFRRWIITISSILCCKKSRIWIQVYNFAFWLLNILTVIFLNDLMRLLYNRKQKNWKPEYAESISAWSKQISVKCLMFTLNQIDSSTIDGNLEFVHSQYSCILTSQVSIQFLYTTKILIIVMILE